jgi:hypothetical protein
LLLPFSIGCEDFSSETYPKGKEKATTPEDQHKKHVEQPAQPPVDPQPPSTTSEPAPAPAPTP